MNNKIVLYALYVVVIGLVIYFAISTGFFGLTGKNNNASKTQYQAVFLSNGQVYFGKFEAKDKESTLSDIYYLQVQQVQPTPEDQTQNKLTLIKLGNELHGPEDKMYINNDQILFWENLNDEGKVVQAIKKYQADGPTQQSTTQPSVETQQ